MTLVTVRVLPHLAPISPPSRPHLAPISPAEIDADGGGALDNKELVQAWQKATGEELTPEQAQEMIDEVDEDHNGTLDQDEFIALIRKRCETPLKSFADQFTDEKLAQIFESACPPTSRPQLAHISPTSRPHLAHSSPTARPQLAHISPTSRPHLAVDVLVLYCRVIRAQCTMTTATMRWTRMSSSWHGRR